mmetsp:Transcript_21914/g.36219  ORF Transcript_21914/g.36219 Transcript_21914/m.36219 type:complete len:226 (-) Transcript_21914:700-1377(-)
MSLGALFFSTVLIAIAIISLPLVGATVHVSIGKIVKNASSYHISFDIVVAFRVDNVDASFASRDDIAFNDISVAPHLNPFSSTIDNGITLHLRIAGTWLNVNSIFESIFDKVAFNDGISSNDTNTVITSPHDVIIHDLVARVGNKDSTSSGVRDFISAHDGVVGVDGKPSVSATTDDVVLDHISNRKRIEFIVNGRNTDTVPFQAVQNSVTDNLVAVSNESDALK